MDFNKIAELGYRLEAAYKAQDNLKDNIELLAKGTREFVRNAIVEYFFTKTMLVAIANTLKIRETHVIYPNFLTNTFNNYVTAGHVGSVCLQFVHNGVLDFTSAVDGRFGAGCTLSRYGYANENTEYTNCRLAWSGSSPDIKSSLASVDWMKKTPEKALAYFDSHRWTAEGYAELKKSAELLNKSTELMKQCFANYSEEIINKVNEDTKNLVC